MPNLLSNPSLWSDDQGSPPAYWNGTSYDFISVDGAAIEAIGAEALPSDGTVEFTLNVITPDTTENPAYCRVQVNDVQVFLQSVAEAGSFEFASGLLSEGDNVIIDFMTIAAGPNIYPLYNGEFNITPTALLMQFSPEYNTPDTQPTNYNCDCDDDFPTATLAQLRTRMAIRMGWAGMVTPPGAAALMDDFLQSAQTLLYRKYSCFRTRRWFTWNMPSGQRFYDFNDNADECLKKLDPRKVVWVGVSKGDDVWQELICGINPLFYSSKFLAIPQYYEFRQCIEVWPAPNDDLWLLRIKGDFGLLPFVADADVTTIDSEAVFLFALANCKMHYGQADAGQVMNTATGLIADYVAGSHFTRRYVPGSVALPNAIPPKMVP